MMLAVIHKTGILTEPGWKSDMEKQIFLSGWNRPEGVNIYGCELVYMRLFDDTPGILQEFCTAIGKNHAK